VLCIDIVIVVEFATGDVVVVVFVSRYYAGFARDISGRD